VVGFHTGVDATRARDVLMRKRGVIPETLLEIATPDPFTEAALPGLALDGDEAPTPLAARLPAPLDPDSPNFDDDGR